MKISMMLNYYQRNFTIWTIKAVLSLSILASCTSEEKLNLDQQSMPELPVTTLVQKSSSIYKEYVTDINAVRNVEIRARVEGFLEKIYVDEGEWVRKGQPLFSLNREEYEAELAKAKANLKSAIANAKASELEVDRVKILVEKEVISATELEVAKAKLAAAAARIEEARSAQSNAGIRLSYTYLLSPFNGIIDRIPLKVGSLITEGTLLTTISDNSSIYCYFNVSESEYLYYRHVLEDGNEKSNVVELRLADGSLYPHKGKIETMEGEFDTRTGTIGIRARFPNPEKILKHGSSGKVRITNTLKKALLLPQKAAFEVQDKNFVYVVDSTNTVRIRSFIPKLRHSHFYIVDQGLEPGDRIVYEGIQNLKDGSSIKPVDLSMDSLINSAEKANQHLK